MSAVVIIAAELLIALRCVSTSRGHARGYRQARLSGAGMGALIGFQGFMNIAVATTGLMPNTGLTLPFVSYGLTSLVSFCIGIGLVLNVGLQVRKY